MDRTSSWRRSSRSEKPRQRLMARALCGSTTWKASTNSSASSRRWKSEKFSRMQSTLNNLSLNDDSRARTPLLTWATIMPSRDFFSAVAAVAVAACCVDLPATRAADWPSRPVKIVIPFSPGGTSDRFGRLVAGELSRSFGQQFYVENKPGGSGMTASGEVAPRRAGWLHAGAGRHGTEYHWAGAESGRRLPRDQRLHPYSNDCWR